MFDLPDFFYRDHHIWKPLSPLYTAQAAYTLRQWKLCPNLIHFNFSTGGTCHNTLTIQLLDCHHSFNLSMLDCHHSFKFINMLCKPIQNFVWSKEDFKIAKWQVNKTLMLAGDVFLAWKLSLVFKLSALYPANRPHAAQPTIRPRLQFTHVQNWTARGGGEVVISSTVHPSCSRERGSSYQPFWKFKVRKYMLLLPGKKNVYEKSVIFFSRFLSGPVQWRHPEERYMCTGQRHRTNTVQYTAVRRTGLSR